MMKQGNIKVINGVLPLLMSFNKIDLFNIATTLKPMTLIC